MKLGDALTPQPLEVLSLSHKDMLVDVVALTESYACKGELITFGTAAVRRKCFCGKAGFFVTSQMPTLYELF